MNRATCALGHSSLLPALGESTAAKDRSAVRAFALGAIIAVLLSGCATTDQSPLDPRIEYRDVPVPTPVPCFAAADRPTLPTPVPVDLDNATPDQIAEANEADLKALRLYAEAAERLLNQCQTKGTTP